MAIKSHQRNNCPSEIWSKSPSHWGNEMLKEDFWNNNSDMKKKDFFHGDQASGRGTNARALATLQTPVDSYFSGLPDCPRGIVLSDTALFGAVT